MSTLSDWLDEHDPANAEAALTSFAAVGVAPARQGQQPAPTSTATITGSGADAAKAADAAAGAAFKSGGAGSPAFLTAFAAAPANGAVTLCSMALTRSGFNPSAGATGSQQYQQFLTSIGTCPLFSVNSSDSVTVNKTAVAPGDVPGELTLGGQFGEAVEQEITATVGQLVEAANEQQANQTQSVLIYIFELSIEDAPSFQLSSIQGDLTAVYTKQKHGNSQSGGGGGGGSDKSGGGGGDGPAPVGQVAFTISATVPRTVLAFQQTQWPSWAAKVGQKLFFTLDQWRQTLTTAGAGGGPASTSE